MTNGMLQGMHHPYLVMHTDGFGNMVFNGGMDGQFTILHDNKLVRITQDDIDAGILDEFQDTAENEAAEIIVTVAKMINNSCNSDDVKMERENEVFHVIIGGLYKFLTRREIRDIANVNEHLVRLEERGL